MAEAGLQGGCEVGLQLGEGDWRQGAGSLGHGGHPHPPKVTPNKAQKVAEPADVQVSNEGSQPQGLPSGERRFAPRKRQSVPVLSNVVHRCVSISTEPNLKGENTTETRDPRWEPSSQKWREH